MSKKTTEQINSQSNFLVPPEKLRWHCPENIFKFKTTEEVEPLDHIIGQSRAVEAIRLGAGLKCKGYNIFVSGLSGTGRLTTVKRILEEVTIACPILFDYCYVNNFTNEDMPRLIKLPRGKGKAFSKAMSDAISYLRQRLPKLFEEESFQAKRRQIIEEYQKKEKAILQNFDERIKPHGFIRGQIENEQGMVFPEIFPVINNKPVHIDTIEELVEKGQISRKKADKIIEDYKKFKAEIYNLARDGMKLMQEFKKALAENDKLACSVEIDPVLESIKETFNNEKIDIYIEEVKAYILDNLSLFLPNIPTPLQVTPDRAEQSDADKFLKFSVNVILDNSESTSAPVIIETTPSYNNLFGTIDRVYDQRGFWRTDFTKIKAGALLKADQGFLIVNAIDLFTEPGVWIALKRVLLYDKLEIQPFDTYFQISQTFLKPEPIQINVKVIIIGGLSLYHLLYNYEKGFKKMFKVNAQFDYETERTEELMQKFPQFISKICRDEHLSHCSPSGVSAIIEWAVEHAGSKNRITLKFSDVADIIRESSFYDINSKNCIIDREDVEKAIEQRKFRNNLIDEKIKYQILQGNILIDTEGERIGQINGLTIIDTGMYSFGKPTRITATVSAGTAGIINVEREVDLSGSIHNKGVLIISGFFRERFSADKPLSLTASLAFEQSYSGIDGDSASAAEIYAIISALAEVPIKQSIAVTGSINQKGDIQPIGGVNQKIQGFYEICKERGLNGKHGVIIPIQNVEDLMLSKEIIESVKNKKFNIWAISKIEDGVEILMGKPAGEKDKNGKYPPNTIFNLVVKKLDKLRESAKEKDKKQKTTKRKKVTKK